MDGEEIALPGDVLEEVKLQTFLGSHHLRHPKSPRNSFVVYSWTKFIVILKTYTIPNVDKVTASLVKNIRLRNGSLSYKACIMYLESALYLIPVKSKHVVRCPVDFKAFRKLRDNVKEIIDLDIGHAALDIVNYSDMLASTEVLSGILFHYSFKDMMLFNTSGNNVILYSKRRSQSLVHSIHPDSISTKVLIGHSISKFEADEVGYSHLWQVLLLVRTKSTLQLYRFSIGELILGTQVEFCNDDLSIDLPTHFLQDRDILSLSHINKSALSITKENGDTIFCRFLGNPRKLLYKEITRSFKLRKKFLRTILLRTSPRVHAWTSDVILARVSKRQVHIQHSVSSGALTTIKIKQCLDVVAVDAQPIIASLSNRGIILVCYYNPLYTPARHMLFRMTPTSLRTRKVNILRKKGALAMRHRRQSSRQEISHLNIERDIKRLSKGIRKNELEPSLQNLKIYLGKESNLSLLELLEHFVEVNLRKGNSGITQLAKLFVAKIPVIVPSSMIYSTKLDATMTLVLFSVGNSLSFRALVLVLNHLCLQKRSRILNVSKKIRQALTDICDTTDEYCSNFQFILPNSILLFIFPFAHFFFNDQISYHGSYITAKNFQSFPRRVLSLLLTLAVGDALLLALKDDLEEAMDSLISFIELLTDYFLFKSLSFELVNEDIWYQVETLLSQEYLLEEVYHLTSEESLGFLPQLNVELLYEKLLMTSSR